MAGLHVFNERRIPVQGRHFKKGKRKQSLKQPSLALQGGLPYRKKPKQIATFFPDNFKKRKQHPVTLTVLHFQRT